MSLNTIAGVFLLIGIAAAVSLTIASVVMTASAPAVTVFATGP